MALRQGDIAIVEAMNLENDLKRRASVFVLAACAAFQPAMSTAVPATALTGIRISAPFMNPTIGQRVEIRFEAPFAGSASVTLLDRDGFRIRSIVKTVSKGPASIVWDGRDDAGRIVPNEAYTPRIEVRSKTGKRATYDPSEGFEPSMLGVDVPTYSPQTASLSYFLTRPSRVHVQAGQLGKDPVTGQMNGSVLRTIVDRQPRVAGTIVEHWAGFDASGRVPVSQLPSFVVGVLATTLPENSIITVGNEKTSFLAYALERRGAAAKPRTLPTPERRTHHEGLNALEDVSPEIAFYKGGTRVDAIGATADGTTRVQLRIDGLAAPHFLAQTATLSVFVNESLVRLVERPKHPFELELSGLPVGDHRLTVNWASRFGPTAVGVATLKR